MPCFKPLLVFSGLLALSLTLGWRGGAASAVADRSRVGGGAVSDPGTSAENVSGAEAGRLSGTAAAGAGAPQDAAAVKAELETLLRRMDEASGTGMDGEFVGMWGMARIACLMQKLSPEEQESVLAGIKDEGLSTEEIEMAKMMLKSFGAMMDGGKGKKEEDFIRELTAMKGPSEMAMMTLASWASHDARGALRHLTSQVSLPDPPAWVGKDAGFLFNALGAQEPQLAAREALSIPDEKLRRAAAGGLSLYSLFKGKREDWSADGTETVKSLIQAVPEKSVDFLTGALNGRLNGESPQEAMQWLESLGLAPGHKPEMEEALHRAWWNQNKEDAANWWIGRTPPEKKAAEIEETVKRWTNAGKSREERERSPEPDLAGCADWILSLGIGPDTEKGISRLADGWIDVGEPAAAIAWARAIPDAAARQASLDNVSTQIRRRYPDTWRAMFSASGLPAAVTAEADGPTDSRTQ